MNISTEGMLRRLRHLPWTIECGVHSNIPSCCIRFYVMRWMFAAEDSVLRRAHRKMMARWGMALVGYIPCDSCCRNGNRATVEPCPESSIPCDHSEEQAL